MGLWRICFDVHGRRIVWMLFSFLTIVIIFKVLGCVSVYGHFCVLQLLVSVHLYKALFTTVTPSRFVKFWVFYMCYMFFIVAGCSRKAAQIQRYFCWLCLLLSRISGMKVFCHYANSYYLTHQHVIYTLLMYHSLPEVVRSSTLLPVFWCQLKMELCRHSPGPRHCLNDFLKLLHDRIVLSYFMLRTG